ncbi:HesB/YadR/YfhF family protein [Gracilibacillus salitolerans]|uniref:HesB/YadR/YfhF family protein n=1 Tax=Gracilibacillus salitolerans TaxID=2663022 RepID=A0A5Q2TP90_9BACI|nr:HesB/YadR/YfhF family protein [Gracilibacillus salitolerans]QGH35843.1 HesB/YadR/YfhF family protein [Gracilibacillus salitolerans]
MEIKVSDQALQWFKDDVEISDGDTIKFQAKYGGYSPIHEGFSLAFALNEPLEDTITITEKNGITFFIDATDAWYFEGYNLIVKYDEELDEVAYDYEEIQ